MKRYILKATAILITIFTVSTVEAQTSRAAYFLESSPYRHNLNPALAPEYAYVGMPLLSNISVDVHSNVGVSNFMYPSESGELMNFLNANVSVDEFLANVKDNNKVSSNLGFTVASVGFNALGGYNTIDISLKTSTSMSLPGELLKFLKIGQGDSDETIYDMGGLNLSARSYVDIALGHTHKINDKWQVGAKVKALVGLASMDAHIKDFNLTMQQDQWLLSTRGEVNVSVPGAEFETETEIGSDGEAKEVVTGVDMSNISYQGINSGGIGFDLGVVYQPIDNLTLSLALTDIGFISWGGNISAKTSGEYTYDGVDISANGDISTEEEEAALAEMLQLEATEKPRSVESLHTALNIGAEYSFLDNAISLGFLSHSEFSSVTYTEAMLVANFRANKAFMMSVNGTLSNMGHTFGALLNVSPRGFNFFLGVECKPAMKVIPDYYRPVNKFNVNITTGISFTFGARDKYEML